MILRRRFSRFNIWFIGSCSELNTLDHPDPATPREIDFSGALLTQNATGEFGGTRRTLWFDAWNLFMERPILGLGWEAFGSK
jgi:hypothetical protein